MLLAAMLLAHAGLAAPPAVEWPTAWTPVLRAGESLSDVCFDPRAGLDLGLDVAGNRAGPAGYVVVDDDNVFFRFRLGESPVWESGVSTEWLPSAWVILLETDWHTANATWDWAVVLDGSQSSLDIATNEGKAEDWTTEAPSTWVGAAAKASACEGDDCTGRVRYGGADPNVCGTGDFSVEIRYPRAELEAATGLSSLDGVGVAFASATPSPWQVEDVTGCDDTTAACPDWADVVGLAPLDFDGDGLSDAEELERNLDPTSTDSDADGLDDAVEDRWDTQPRDSDSDDDGLLDGAEVDAGTDPLDPDTDDDGTPDGTDPDPGQWTPDTGEPDTAVPDTADPETGEPDTAPPDTGVTRTAGYFVGGACHCGTSPRPWQGLGSLLLVAGLALLRRRSVRP